MTDNVHHIEITEHQAVYGPTHVARCSCGWIRQHASLAAAEALAAGHRRSAEQAPEIQPPSIRTHEPTMIAAGYRDEGIVLSWPVDPDADPSDPETLWQHLPLGDTVDQGITAAAALTKCATSGEQQNCNQLAVSMTTDGTKVALMWMERGDGINALLIATGAVSALVEQMRRAVDDRDQLLAHDADVQDADPDDFK
jgi:hypothetical protein